MIVQCESCGTKFRLDDEKVPDKGIKAQCSKCRHIFEVGKPPVNSMKDIDNSETKGESPEPRIIPSPEDISYTPKRRPLKSLIILTILLLLGGGGYLYWDSSTAIKWRSYRLSDLKGVFSSTTSPYGDVVFSISGTTGYHIDNPRTGRIFVIDGGAINNSSKTKGFIKVKGTLFDSIGREVRKKEVYCGNILSRQELMDMEADEISFHLNHPAGESSNTNIDIPPQKSVPFMIVFFNLPDDLAEFSIESAVTNKPTW